MVFGKLSAEPLFRSLDIRAAKEVGFDDELSERVDEIVLSIQHEKNESKKRQLFDKLLVHVHKRLLGKVDVFYKRWENLMIKNGFTKEDMYVRAVEALMESAYTWKDQKTRSLKGEVPANFNTYFFEGGLELFGALREEFVRPFLTARRKADIVDIDQPINRINLDSGSNEEFMMTDHMVDHNVEDPFFYTLKNQESTIILDKLYRNENPFLSFVIILRFGLGKEVLGKWQQRFSASDKALISKVKKKFVSRVEQGLENYVETGMTLEQVGEILDISRQAVLQMEEKALGILKKRLKLEK